MILTNMIENNLLHNDIHQGVGKKRLFSVNIPLSRLTAPFVTSRIYFHSNG
jgi:hypothetical protein